MREKEYQECSPEYLTLAIQGKRKAEGAQARELYEIARTLAYFTVQPHTKKKLDPKKMWGLPWDVKTKVDADFFKENKHLFDKLTLN